jgi:hypothetical protein
LTAAQYKTMQEDYPEMIAQSIEYVSNLAERSELSKAEQRVLNQTSISKYFSTFFGGECNFAFFRYSTKLLNNRIV